MTVCWASSLAIIVLYEHMTSWRASESSETLLVVVQWKTRYVYTYIYIYLASKRSERDTLRCNAIEISLYLFIGERAKRATHYQGCTNSSWCGMYIYIYIARCQVVVKFYRDLYFCNRPANVPRSQASGDWTHIDF